MSTPTAIPNRVYSPREFEAIVVKKWCDGRSSGRDPGLIRTMDSVTPEWKRNLEETFIKTDNIEQIPFLKNQYEHLMKRSHGKIHKLPKEMRLNYAARVWARKGEGKKWRGNRESYETNQFTEKTYRVSNPNFTALRPGSLKEILEGCNCCVYFEVPSPTKEGITIET
ncbi:MAG: hypothetical protein AABW88_02380, partial [Nanoarchaeota archaeon]